MKPKGLTLKLNSTMKTSLILLASALITPTFALVGIGTTVAFGIATIVAVSAMLIQDYGSGLSYHSELAGADLAQRAEAHPMAA